MKSYLLSLALACAACSGVSDYRVSDEHLIAQSDLVYLTVTKGGTDPRLVALSPSSNSQQDVATLFSVSNFAAMSGNSLRKNLLPMSSPPTDKRGAPAITVTGPGNEVAYVWFATDTQESAVIVWRAGRSTPVDVGAFSQPIEVGVTRLGVTLFRPGDLSYAHFRWEGPVATSFAPVPIATSENAETLEFASLSPGGTRALFRASPERYVVFDIPSGSPSDTIDFSTAPEDVIWFNDAKLLVNSKDDGKVRTLVRELGNSAATNLGVTFDLPNAQRFAMSDVLLFENTVLTPDGIVTKVESARGLVIEGRRGWALNATGDITAYDFDRKSSKSLGRLRGSVALIGKNDAGLIILERENPARVWIVNADLGTRRDVVITTTTADGVVEVGGRD